MIPHRRCLYVTNAPKRYNTSVCRPDRIIFWNQNQVTKSDVRWTTLIARRHPCVHSRHVRSRGETT
jgi:hypothetical protein